MGNSLSPLQKEAPQLTKYFKHQTKHDKDAAKMREQAVDRVNSESDLEQRLKVLTETQEKLQRMQTALIDKLKVKARKAFKHHDVDDNGELDEAESKIFFEHYTRLCLSVDVVITLHALVLVALHSLGWSAG